MSNEQLKENTIKFGKLRNGKLGFIQVSRVVSALGDFGNISVYIKDKTAIHGIQDVSTCYIDTNFVANTNRQNDVLSLITGGQWIENKWGCPALIAQALGWIPGQSTLKSIDIE